MTHEDTIFAQSHLNFDYSVVTKAHLLRWVNALPDTAAVGIEVDFSTETIRGLRASWELR